MILPELARRICWTLRTLGPMGRRDLARRLDIRPNTIGDAVNRLIKQGLLCEGESETAGRGRPLVPLRIDTERRVVVGLSMEPGRVGVSRMNLEGRPIGEPVRQRIDDPNRMIAAARKLLADHLDQRVLAVGLSTTGFVDPATRQVLLSSAMTADQPVSLAPLYEQAGDLPIVLDNDLHALAAAWLLTHRTDTTEDMLLVELRDGAVGAAMLVNGRPNRGCIVSANEIGHTRTDTPTEKCYCGQTGCMERVFSSPFLGSQPGASDDLAHRIASPRRTDRRLHQMVDLISNGLANAVNLIRPNRVVLHLCFEDRVWLFEQLKQGTQSRLLAPLVPRVAIDDWGDSRLRFSQPAGWLALAGLYAADWL
ncbi:MAG: ROK family transcriptional regulator [Phycisphaeraceae bacterium]